MNRIDSTSQLLTIKKQLNSNSCNKFLLESALAHKGWWIPIWRDAQSLTIDHRGGWRGQRAPGAPPPPVCAPLTPCRSSCQITQLLASRPCNTVARSAKHDSSSPLLQGPWVDTASKELRPLGRPRSCRRPRPGDSFPTSTLGVSFYNFLLANFYVASPVACRGSSTCQSNGRRAASNPKKPKKKLIEAESVKLSSSSPRRTPINLSKHL